MFRTHKSGNHLSKVSLPPHAFLFSLGDSPTKIWVSSLWGLPTFHSFVSKSIVSVALYESSPYHRLRLDPPSP